MPFWNSYFDAFKSIIPYWSTYLSSFLRNNPIPRLLVGLFFLSFTLYMIRRVLFAER